MELNEEEAARVERREGGRKELRKARKMKKGNERRKEGEKKDAYYITNFKCLVSLA